ncbi:RNA 2',3'-cyclic phosphodiesterase [Enterovirga sp.]|jgi:2'-5' RNA ligase|uniref:RNA 2',3'-cyclic phosphodiesterase n=1 Tax=Enterovirga sp. TaxID=2026350 RepID=UPI002622CD34|nr:RNA 2',3'-cyclic phosphodiesterase [Enterovirga sp.]MDB5589839.1 2-5 ligase [Enterovirga sp.]
MPRLFTALEIPAGIADELASLRGGVPGARWIEPAHYHVTLRFLGDVDHGTARDAAALLGEARHRSALTLSLDALGVFGGDRPRALYARVVPTPELTRFQAEQEKLLRRAGLPPETRKFTPHVTLARLRDVRPGDIAAAIARHGRFPPLSFTATRFVIFSARDSVGGGPYLVEAAYPLAPAASASREPPAAGNAARAASMA